MINLVTDLGSEECQHILGLGLVGLGEIKMLFDLDTKVLANDFKVMQIGRRGRESQ